MKIKRNIILIPLLLIPLFKIKAAGLYDPLTGSESTQSTQTLEFFIGSFIQGILGLFGALSLLMFVYGGFLWITSAGNMDKVKQGKDTIIWASAAIVVIFTSYAIIEFVFKLVTS
tara:strand:- start:528 stop:872 length:345 start_codon:yes stop_codon:yes gene_type:complete